MMQCITLHEGAMALNLQRYGRDHYPIWVCCKYYFIAVDYARHGRWAIMF